MTYAGGCTYNLTMAQIHCLDCSSVHTGSDRVLRPSADGTSDLVCPDCSSPWYRAHGGSFARRVWEKEDGSAGEAVGNVPFAQLQEIKARRRA